MNALLYVLCSINAAAEALMSRPFERAASWYPHTKGSWEILKEVAHLSVLSFRTDKLDVHPDLLIVGGSVVLVCF